MWRAVFILWVLSWASFARAEDVTLERKAGLDPQGGKLRMSLGLSDLFSAWDLERLRSGFTTRVLIRIAVVTAEDERVVAETTRLSEIVYDLWDEKLRVRHSSGRPLRMETHEVSNTKAAMELATMLWGFPVVELDRLQNQVRYRVRVRADLNPISEELIQNLRRWLSPSSRQGPSGDRFFGSFLRVFVNPRIEDSERVLHCASQVFTKPTRAP